MSQALDYLYPSAYPLCEDVKLLEMSVNACARAGKAYAAQLVPCSKHAAPSNTAPAYCCTTKELPIQCDLGAARGMTDAFLPTQVHPIVYPVCPVSCTPPALIALHTRDAGAL